MAKQTVKVTGEVFRVYPEGRRHGSSAVPHEDFTEMRAAIKRACVIAGTNDLNIIVDRVTQHEPTINDGSMYFLMAGPVTETVTGTWEVQLPHFTEPSLSRYHPVNGWVMPETIEVEFT